jgi:hypothetical protein
MLKGVKYEKLFYLCFGVGNFFLAWDFWGVFYTAWRE